MASLLDQAWDEFSPEDLRFADGICINKQIAQKQNKFSETVAHSMCCLFTFSKLTHVLDSGLPNEDMNFCGHGQLV